MERFKVEIEAASSGLNIRIRNDTPDSKEKTEQRTYTLHDCNGINMIADESNVLSFENN